MQNVIVKCDQLWKFFIERFDELDGVYLRIATWEEAGIDIYLTRENDLPYFCVDVDNSTEYEVETYGEEDAVDNYRQILSLYFDGVTGETEDSDEDEVPDYDDDSFDDDIDRLDEIICAADDLVRVLIGTDPVHAGFSTDDFQSIAMMVAEHIFNEYGISVYFPTQKNGVFTKYPFGEGEEEGE